MRRALAVFVMLLLCASVAGAAEKPTLAILYFDYHGKETDEMAFLRKGLAQMLISDLVGHDAATLVERDRLEEILAELKLAQSGKIDRAQAAKVGKLLGARYMVIGGYFEHGGQMNIDAKLVNVETGVILESANARGKSEEFMGLEAKLATDLAGLISKQLKPTATATAALPAPRVKRPAKLSAKVAALYARGLDEIDRGQKDKARETLTTVVKEQEDFKLAAVDLDKLMQ